METKSVDSTKRKLSKNKTPTPKRQLFEKDMHKEIMPEMIYDDCLPVSVDAADKSAIDNVESIHEDVETESDSEDNTSLNPSVIKERRLFFECTNGDLEKYKYSIRLESFTTAWIGITARFEPFKYYLTVKNNSTSVSTIFIDQKTKNQLDTAVLSFVRTGNLPHTWKKDGMAQSNLEYLVENEHLIIKQHLNSSRTDLKPLKSFIFDKDMATQYVDAMWQIDRFAKYIISRNDLVSYGESILVDTANRELTITKDLFTHVFYGTTPPNGVLTAGEIWNILKSKYMHK